MCRAQIIPGDSFSIKHQAFYPPTGRLSLFLDFPAPVLLIPGFFFFFFLFPVFNLRVQSGKRRLKHISNGRREIQRNERKREEVELISFHTLAILCLSGSIWGAGVLRAAAHPMPVMISPCCAIAGCCLQHFQRTPGTLNWPSSLPVACQSREPHLYASKPLGWSLTLQSSVNYPVTDSLAVILQTIKQAIKPLCIAGSGPERPGHLHPAGCPICLFIYIPTNLFGCTFFSPGEGRGGSGLQQPSTGASF